jgi:hypothetical protein
VLESIPWAFDSELRCQDSRQCRGWVQVPRLQSPGVLEHGMVSEILWLSLCRIPVIHHALELSPFVPFPRRPQCPMWWKLASCLKFYWWSSSAAFPSVTNEWRRPLQNAKYRCVVHVRFATLLLQLWDHCVCGLWALLNSPPSLSQSLIVVAPTSPRLMLHRKIL